MKKWLISFAAMLFAVSAIAQSLNSYVPADAMLVGSVNGPAVLQSKCYNALLYALTQKTMAELLKEQGKTIAQARKETGTAVFFLKFKSFAPQVVCDGGAVVRGVDKNSFVTIRNVTMQSAEAELKKNGLDIAKLKQFGVNMEIIKVAGRNSILLSVAGAMPIQICFTGITNDLFQVRFALGAPVEKKLFTPLKNYSALTRDLDYNSLFSLAANVPSVVRLTPAEAQQDPVAKSLKNVSCSAREVNDKLILQARINTVSPDAGKMIQAQLNALIETLKADPANKTLAEMMKLEIAGSTVKFKAELPVDFVLTSLAALAVQPQRPAAKPAVAPAAK